MRNVRAVMGASATTMPRSNEFERLARRARGIGRTDTDRLASVLLGGLAPLACTGSRALHPLWRREALHRAGRILELTARLERSWGAGLDPAHMQLALALADMQRQLALCPERRVVSCSTLLRDTVTTFVTLFGPATGDVRLRTEIERLSMPGFQRRALVLAALDLVSDALLHAWSRPANRTLLVRLSVAAPAAELEVGGDGVCSWSPKDATRPSVAGALADLLCGALRQERSAAGASAIVVFVSNSWSEDRANGTDTDRHLMCSTISHSALERS